MPLDPQVKGFLEQMAEASLGAPTISSFSPSEYRAISNRNMGTGSKPEEVSRIQEVQIPVEDGEIMARIYTPEGNGPYPVFLFFHGGGWVIGSVDTHDGMARMIANASGAIVVSVDYRLAPEHKFPVATEDCYHALLWVEKHIEEHGGMRDCLIVGGDSAGGNLAAVVTLMAKERSGPKMAGQVLIYPDTSFTVSTPSMKENAEGYFLTKDMMNWFAYQYLRDEDRTSPYASPLSAGDLSALPKALVLTAEYDPLRDEGRMYADALAAAGVSVQYKEYKGMIHGFVSMADALDQGKEAIRHIGAAIKGMAAEKAGIVKDS